MLRRTKVIKIMHNLCFSFLLAIKAVPREIENNAYANFFFSGGGRGGNKAQPLHKQKHQVRKCCSHAGNRTRAVCQ